MKKLFVFFMILLATPCARAFVTKNTAFVQVLDKTAGKTQMLEIPVGTPVSFEKLIITVRACMQSGPFDAENFYAFTEIGRSGEDLFYSNWMDRNNPGRNPVQNPDYDLWLVRCE